MLQIQMEIIQVGRFFHVKLNTSVNESQQAKQHPKVCYDLQQLLNTATIFTCI